MFPLEQKTLFEFDAMPFEEFDIFITKRAGSVMFFLFSDVLLN